MSSETEFDMTNPDVERLWRVQEVAQFLNVAPGAVYKARSEQGLPAITIGGTLRFRPSSVRAWAAEQETATGEKAKEGRPRTVKRVVGRRVFHQEVPPVKLLA
jgi:excisionase family DNA binding protein